MNAARILVVDDHPGNLKLLSFMLSELGYEVRAAADAFQARRLVRVRSRQATARGRSVVNGVHERSLVFSTGSPSSAV